MPESVILWISCAKCGHKWKPFGDVHQLLPARLETICPNCDDKSSYEWLDTVTAVKLRQKELGLSPADEVQATIKQLENRIGVLEAKVEVNSKQAELVELKQKELGEWAKKREQVFIDLENIAREIEEEEKFKRDGR